MSRGRSDSFPPYNRSITDHCTALGGAGNEKSEIVSFMKINESCNNRFESSVCVFLCVCVFLGTSGVCAVVGGGGRGCRHHLGLSSEKCTGCESLKYLYGLGDGLGFRSFERKAIQSESLTKYFI